MSDQLRPTFAPPPVPREFASHAAWWLAYSAWYRQSLQEYQRVYGSPVEGTADVTPPETPRERRTGEEPSQPSP